MKYDKKECPDCGSQFLGINGMSGVQFCNECTWFNEQQEEYYDNLEDETIVMEDGMTMTFV